jgi:anti-anti-sigma factor
VTCDAILTSGTPPSEAPQRVDVPRKQRDERLRDLAQQRRVALEQITVEVLGADRLRAQPELPVRWARSWIRRASDSSVEVREAMRRQPYVAAAARATNVAGRVRVVPWRAAAGATIIVAVIDTEVVVPGQPLYMPFSVAVHRGAARTRVVVCGELDRTTAPQLSAILRDRLSARDDVVVDLLAVTFIDLGGVAALWSASCRAAGAGCRLDVRATRRAARVFRLVGLDRPLNGATAISLEPVAST